MQNVDMKEAANENEPLTFQSLGLAAALVINRIRNAQTLRDLQTDSPENGKDNDTPDNNHGSGNNEEDKDRLIERRVR
jgi:hypothetical protein